MINTLIYRLKDRKFQGPRKAVSRKLSDSQRIHVVTTASSVMDCYAVRGKSRVSTQVFWRVASGTSNEYSLLRHSVPLTNNV